MKYLTVLLTLVALFACMAAAGWKDPNQVDNMLYVPPPVHRLKLKPVTDTTRSIETRRGSNTRPRPFASRARRRTANASVRL